MGFNDMEIHDDTNFLKVGAGESVQFHLISKDPVKSVTHWIDKKPTPCEGKTCSLCVNKHRPRRSWKVSVYDRKTETVKEFEFGPQIAAQLKNIAELLVENHQTIHDVDIRVKREGSTKEDTEYFVNQVPSKGPVPEDAIPF